MSGFYGSLGPYNGYRIFAAVSVTPGPMPAADAELLLIGPLSASGIMPMYNGFFADEHGCRRFHIGLRTNVEIITWLEFELTAIWSSARS